MKGRDRNLRLRRMTEGFGRVTGWMIVESGDAPRRYGRCLGFLRCEPSSSVQADQPPKTLRTSSIETAAPVSQDSSFSTASSLGDVTGIGPLPSVRAEAPTAAIHLVLTHHSKLPVVRERLHSVMCVPQM